MSWTGARARDTRAVDRELASQPSELVAIRGGVQPVTGVVPTNQRTGRRGVRQGDERCARNDVVVPPVLEEERPWGRPRDVAQRLDLAQHARDRRSACG